MCPPGVDQTTRTAQRWIFMAPLRQQRIPFPDHVHRRATGPDQYMTSASSFKAFDRLVNAQPGVVDIVDLLPPSTPRKANASRSRFEALPAELLDMIIKDNELAPAAVLALGLTCQTLWLHVAAHIRSETLARLGQWADTPFLVTGTYLTSLPLALYQYYPGMREQEIAFAARPGNRKGQCPARRWNWAAYDQYKDVANALGGQAYLDAFDHYRLSLRLPAKTSAMIWAIRFYDDLRSVLTQHLLNPVRLKSGSQWVLRNQTTKEYVRLHFQDKEAADARAPHIKGMKLLTADKILLMHCTWTSKSAYESEGKEYMCHDAWAGHCFDIVAWNQGDSVDVGWTEVTEAVAKEGKRATSYTSREVSRLRRWM